MEAWWDGLSQMLRVLYCIAIPSTLVLILQMIMSMLGAESDGGVDVSDTSGLDLSVDTGADTGMDVDVAAEVHDGGNPADFGNLKLLTLQTIVTFLTVFSWVSIVCISSGVKPLLSILLGVVFGGIMMLIVAKIVQVSARLAENGIINLKNAIGETATVYLQIPAKGMGEGKVTMQLQGRLGEYDAITEENAPIPTGAQVLVTDVLGDALVVERSTKVS